MYFLNLSLAQFLVVFGAISATAVALYLLDRSRRRLVVSTLRFWVSAEQPTAAARKRRIQQPWSLALQLISMALLLLAIAQMRIGPQAATPRDHVIVLDTSSWMAARSGNRTLMDVARDRARQYLRAVPQRDRVMLVRADALTTPATAFEPDRRKVEQAIVASEPGPTALDIQQALAFARRIQQQGGRRAGEVAFVGAGRIAEHEGAGTPEKTQNLRVITVADTVENCGIRKVGMRRSSADPDVWEIYVSLHNYGSSPRAVDLALSFGLPAPAPGRTIVGSRRLTVPAGGDLESTFEYKTRGAGILTATMGPHDGFPADDQVDLEVPAQPQLKVTVYSNEPDLLKPVLAANSRVAAVYRNPAQYRADDTGLVILDRFVPKQRPQADSIWIDPPAQGSPVPVRSRVSGVPFGHWNPGHPTTEGLRTKDFKLQSASVFEAAADDFQIGEVEAGPVAVARNAKPRLAVLGFHPVLSGMRYELATPLLFADLMRWMAPESFRRWELAAAPAGHVKLALDQDTRAADIKVTHADGSPLPFTLRERMLEFYSGAPGAVRVAAGDREYLYSLTLPQLWDSKWEPPTEIRHGVPRPATVRDAASELWPWLAIAGALGLLAEWLIYGRFRRSLTGAPALLFWRRKAALVGKGRS